MEERGFRVAPDGAGLRFLWIIELAMLRFRGPPDPCVGVVIGMEEQKMAGTGGLGFRVPLDGLVSCH